MMDRSIVILIVDSMTGTAPICIYWSLTWPSLGNTGLWLANSRSRDPILTSDWLQGGGDLGPGLPQTQPCGGQGQSAGARDQSWVSSPLIGPYRSRITWPPYWPLIGHFFLQGVPKKSVISVQMLLEALKNELQIKVGWVWKIQEISSPMSTETLYFYLKLLEV